MSQRLSKATSTWGGAKLHKEKLRRCGLYSIHSGNEPSSRCQYSEEVKCWVHAARDRFVTNNKCFDAKSKSP